MWLGHAAQQTTHGATSCGANGSLDPGGHDDALPDMAAAEGSLYTLRSTNPVGDTRPGVPSSMTPFRVLCSRDSRPQTDTMIGGIDEAGFRGGPDSFRGGLELSRCGGKRRAEQATD